MRAKRAKQLKRFARRIGKPYKAIKHSYKQLNREQKTEFLTKLETLP
jgi:polyphosphate kinase 2 (PPK2 family)